MNIKRISALLAWFIIATIAFATLAPMNWRPHLGEFVRLERFGAFAVLGFLFTLAYPRRALLVLLCVLIAAAGLEMMQMLTLDRHTQLSDVMIKAAGGAAGVAIAWFLVKYGPLRQKNHICGE